MFTSQAELLSNALSNIAGPKDIQAILQTFANCGLPLTQRAGVTVNPTKRVPAGGGYGDTYLVNNNNDVGWSPNMLDPNNYSNQFVYGGDNYTYGDNIYHGGDISFGDTKIDASQTNNWGDYYNNAYYDQRRISNDIYLGPTTTNFDVNNSITNYSNDVNVNNSITNNQTTNNLTTQNLFTTNLTTSNFNIQTNNEFVTLQTLITNIFNTFINEGLKGKPIDVEDTAYVLDQKTEDVALEGVVEEDEPDIKTATIQVPKYKFDSETCEITEDETFIDVTFTYEVPKLRKAEKVSVVSEATEVPVTVKTYRVFGP